MKPLTAVKGTVCSIKNVYRQNTNIAELLVGKHNDRVQTDMFLQTVKQSADDSCLNLGYFRLKRSSKDYQLCIGSLWF